MKAGRRITVILVDGHRLIHYAFRFLLGETEDLIFTGSAITREEGLKLARETVPDVAVIEISQAIMGGLLLVQQIAREIPSTNIVALSAQDERHVVQKAFDFGAKAYVSKRSHGDRLLQAIRAAAEGGLYIDPVIAPAMLPRRGAAISSSAGAGPTAPMSLRPSLAPPSTYAASRTSFSSLSAAAIDSPSWRVWSESSRSFQA